MEEINKKKEKSGSSSCSQDQDPARPDDIISLKAVNGGIKLGNNEDDSSKPSTWKKTNELEFAKVEMGEVMLENKRLKSDIDRIMKDYQALQTRFHEMARHESKSHLEDIGNTCIDNNQGTTRQLEDGAHELTLSLGRNTVFDSENNNRPDFRPHETLKESSGLSLSLDYNKNEGGSKTSTEQVAPMQNSSTDNSLDEPKDEAGEAWPPSKVLKNMKSSSGGGGRDDEVVQQPPVKKARVSVRARCDTPTMNDGCQWRKYGQKIAKGNPCPRAYYRCTVAPSCPVRKQVQRCADDMSILITTYEGTHNHSLPISATAMASTTSAAAFMLISGSSTNSGLGSTGSAPTTTNTSTNFASNSVSNLQGLNFNFSDTSRSSPLFLPNSSFLPSLSQPTITLDLTTSSTSSTSISQLSKLAPINFAPRSYPTATNLTFNSLDMSNSNLTNKTLPISWPPNGLLSYNSANSTTHARTHVGPKPTTNGAMSCDQETFYQTLLQMINPSPNYNILTPNSSNKQPPQPSLETVAATAKVITSDPSFQSVLTVALSTLISKNNNTNGTSNVGVSAGNPNVVDNCHTSDFTHKVKWGNQKSSTSTLADDGVKASNGCTSSFLSIEPNNTPISPDANLMIISSHLPFPAPSKSTSTS